MTVAKPSFSVGIEEEYLLVDRQSRDIVEDCPPELMRAAEEALTGQVSPEFLRCQIEVGTRPSASIATARDDLARLRATLSTIAGDFGLAPIAASTHPFADWLSQQVTAKDRYTDLARDIGAPLRRMLICGMHVHVAVEDTRLRIDLMNQVRYFLPHLMVLSTSAPFWQGIDTGLKSYRLSVFGELPRTGLPEEFLSWGEYEAHVATLVNTGVIQDGTKLWWDIRPSARYPTLELRITDICTRLDDTITIAALFVSLLHMLYRLRRGNVRWRSYKSMLINENRWRAMRYGFDEGLIDFGRGAIVPYAELLDELLEMVEEDAQALGCTAEVMRAREILLRGTSAHNQLRVYHESLAAGASVQEALAAVVDWLIDETVAGIGQQPALAAAR